jgi:hypothetical protein
MTKAEYIQQVLSVMNEAYKKNEYDDTSLFGSDPVEITDYIEDCYLPAWIQCARVCPRIWLNQKLVDLNVNLPVAEAHDGTGYVTLADDFFFLACFKMKGWDRPVFEAVTEETSIAALQTNEYTRGSFKRPVCILSSEKIGGKAKYVMRYYSLPRGVEHVIEKFSYIPKATEIKSMEDTYTMEISKQLLPALLYMNAAVVFHRFEKADIAASLEQKSLLLLIN